jgi:hypothetical protein
LQLEAPPLSITLLEKSHARIPGGPEAYNHLIYSSRFFHNIEAIEEQEKTCSIFGVQFILLYSISHAYVVAESVINK